MKMTSKSVLPPPQFHCTVPGLVIDSRTGKVSDYKFALIPRDNTIDLVEEMSRISQPRIYIDYWPKV